MFITVVLDSLTQINQSYSLVNYLFQSHIGLRSVVGPHPFNKKYTLHQEFSIFTENFNKG